MTCPRCKHEYYWGCGCNYRDSHGFGKHNGFFHCPSELLVATNPYVNLLIALLTIILTPVVFFIGGIVAVFALAVELFDKRRFYIVFGLLPIIVALGIIFGSLLCAVLSLPFMVSNICWFFKLRGRFKYV